MLHVKQDGIKYYFMIQPGIEPQSPRPLANTLTIMLMNLLKRELSGDPLLQSPNNN